MFVPANNLSMMVKKSHLQNNRQHTGESPETSIVGLLAVTAFFPDRKCEPTHIRDYISEILETLKPEK